MTHKILSALQNPIYSDDLPPTNESKSTHTETQRHEEKQGYKLEVFGVNRKNIFVFDFLRASVPLCETVLDLAFIREGILISSILSQSEQHTII
jgi:hypothetical protein